MHTSDSIRGNDHEYLRRLNRTLVGHLPLDGQPDRRGWEWYYLWSACHPEVRTLYLSPKRSFATWSPDGEYIAASGDIWRASTGEAVYRLSMSTILRYRSAWSPDSQMLAWGMAADDSGIYVWDRATDKVRELRGHASSVWSVAWSPNGKQLASGGIGGKIIIWDVATGEVMRTYDAGDHVSSVAWSPDGELVAACIKGQHLGVWNSSDGEPIVRMKLSISGDTKLTQLSWHPDGEQLAISASNGWCLVRRSDWTVRRQHDLEVWGSDVAWSPDGETLALADGETVVLWDPSKQQLERMLRGHSGRIAQVDWSPDGQQLVTSDDAGEVKIWNLTVPVSLPGFSIDGPVQSLSWQADNKTLAVVDRADRTSSVWNALDGRRVSITPPKSEGHQAWSADRQRVAYYRDGNAAEIRVINTESAEVHAVWRGATGEEVANLAWSPDGKMLAIAKHFPKASSATEQDAGEKSVTLWDVDREQTVSNWNYRGPAVWDHKIRLDWSPKLTQVAVSALGETGDGGSPVWNGHVYVVDAARAFTVLKHTMPHRADVSAVAWNPDGRAFVAGNTDGLIEAVDVESGRTLFVTQLHSTVVNALSWSPDGRRIVSAAADGSIKLLAAEDGADLMIFPLGGKATHVVWSPAGNRLAAATAAGQIHVWDAARAAGLSEQGDRRGELAWAYYTARPHELPAEREARLREMLRVVPDTLEFWQARGEARAALGDFKTATEEFAKAMAPGIERSFTAASAYGLSLLATGHVDAFRKHCVSLHSKFIDTRVPSNGGHVAWICALAPNQDVDTESLVRMAREDLARNANDGIALATLQLSAALYRHGLFQEAADHLNGLVERLERAGDPTQKPLQADSLYFLAMTRHQLGHAYQARRHLNEAAKIAEQLLTPSWQTIVQHQVLDREARALIGD